MSEITREQNQWRKGKTPIIVKYSDDHSKMMAEIAGRGFLKLPGYAYDIENQLEVAAKIGLSELNYNILKETIERELKQSGVDYDLAYKNALMSWELEKQALMAAWEAEYAGIKKGMESDTETLNMLAIEVSRRAITLLEAKAAIEVEMEGYRKTLADLDGDVSPYEVQLANAKLLTAQKKLELLPIIEAIITKEQELLVIEQGKAAAYTDYMVAEQEVITKKQTLTPFVNDLASRVEDYATKVTDIEVPIEQQIAEEKLSQAEIAVQKADYKVRELAIDVEIETKNIGLMDAKRTLQETEFANSQSLVTTEKNLNINYQNDEMASFETILQGERDATAGVIADRAEAHTIKNATALTSATTIANEEISTDAAKTSLEVYRATNVANAQAAAHITASLQHIIG
ncbi:MAG: hypothetical protein M0P26_05645 [Bacteroidales bacterium]|nr:hypothetical protein [Bacteroidales bacterium]